MVITRRSWHLHAINTPNASKEKSNLLVVDDLLFDMFDFILHLLYMAGGRRHEAS